MGDSTGEDDVRGSSAQTQEAEPIHPWDLLKGTDLVRAQAEFLRDELGRDALEFHKAMVFALERSLIELLEWMITPEGKSNLIQFLRSSVGSDPKESKHFLNKDRADWDREPWREEIRKRYRPLWP